MKRITMNMILLPREKSLNPKSAAQQAINNMNGFLYFLGIQNIRDKNVWEQGFTLDFEVPEKKVKRFVWLFDYCDIGRPQGCHIMSIYPQGGGQDLRASTKKEEARADYEQAMRIARDRGKYLPIGFQS